MSSSLYSRRWLKITSYSCSRYFSRQDFSNLCLVFCCVTTCLNTKGKALNLSNQTRSDSTIAQAVSVMPVNCRNCVLRMTVVVEATLEGNVHNRSLFFFQQLLCPFYSLGDRVLILWGSILSLLGDQTMIFNWLFQLLKWFWQLWHRLDEKTKRQIMVMSTSLQTTVVIPSQQKSVS